MHQTPKIDYAHAHTHTHTHFQALVPSQCVHTQALTNRHCLCLYSFHVLCVLLLINPS